MLLVLLIAVLYPALVLDATIAPADSLRTAIPWREQWGPYPSPSPLAIAAATHLGPRLHLMRSEGLAAALWDPWIGGGRPGWLSSPVEGGAPLSVVAVMLSRPGREWTALVAFEVAFAALGAWWVAWRSGIGAAAACVASVAYALSGAASVHWLDWQGSAFALTPWLLWPALAPAGTAARRIAQWTIVAAVTGLCGVPAAPALAAAVVIAALRVPRRSVATITTIMAGALLAAVLLAPILWLRSAGREGSTTPAIRQMTPPLASFLDLLRPSRPSPRETSDLGSGGPTPFGSAEAFLSATTVGLALLGIVAGTLRRRAVWLALLGSSVFLVAGPDAAAQALALPVRPWAVLVLAAAVLAAAGTDAVARRFASPAAEAIGATCVATCLLALLPAAAALLPYASGSHADLQQPLSLPPWPHGPRFLGLLGAVLPDAAGLWELADARAADLADEPRYAARLQSSGTRITAARALSARVAALGVGVLVEPQTARVVSAEAFGRVTVTERQPSPAGPWAAPVPVDVPPQASRLGLARVPAGVAVTLIRRGHRIRLASDATLAAESAAWRWYAIPGAWPAGPAQLAVAGPPGLMVAEIAWDTSGLRVIQETPGLRVWSWARAVPAARVIAAPSPAPTGVDVGGWPLADAIPGSRATLVEAQPSRLVWDVTSPQAGILATLVKFRPLLWRATVDSVAMPTVASDDLWTGVAVPAGLSRIVLAARLPASTLLASLVAMLTLVILALAARRLH